MKETNYNKKQITGKRTHLVLSKEAYLALKSQKEKLGISNTTQYIESLLLLTHEKNGETTFDNANKLYDKLTSLINFNKKLFLDLNATFSNINQIAYKFNLAHINGELNDIVTKEIHKEVNESLSKVKVELIDLRILTKHIINMLESKQQSLKRKR